MLTQSFWFSEREEQSPTKLSLNCGCFLKCSPFYLKMDRQNYTEDRQTSSRGEGNGGQFLGAFVCFGLVFLPGSFPCFYQFYLIFFFFFLFFVFFYLSMYLIITCLVCLGALRPCTSKNLFRPVCLSLCLIGIYVFLPKSAHK